jgi:hypothetical protein
MDVCRKENNKSRSKKAIKEAKKRDARRLGK